MPPGTTLRNIRIKEPLWRAAQAQAEREGITVSDHIRDDLTRWTNHEEETND